MKLSLFADKFDSEPQPVDVDCLDDLTELLRELQHPDKETAPLWCPAELDGGKTEAHAKQVHLLALDFDTEEPPWDRLAAWDYIAHTTHSHKPEAPKWRVIVQLDEPVPAGEWKDRFKLKCAMHSFPCDPKCCNPNRSFYVPPPNAEWAINSGGFSASMPPYTPAAPDSRIDPDQNEDGLLSDGSAFWSQVEGMMKALPPSVAGQGGDDRLYEAACILRKAFRLTREASFRALQIFNARCQPPWEESRLWYKIDQAVNDVQHIAGDLIPEAAREALIREASAKDPRLAVKNSPFRLIHASELAAPLGEVPWLVKRLGIAPGRPTVVNGYAGAGKTFAAQEIAISVASGKPVFGTMPVRQGSVLHIDVDQGRRADAARYQLLAAGRGLDLAELPIDLVVFQGYLTAGGEINPQAIKDLSTACEGRALCIIDSLRGIAPDLDENSSSFGQVLQVLTAITAYTEDETGLPCTFLVLHHEGKPAQGSGRAAKHSGRGTSAIQDRAGAVWRLVQDENTKLVEWTQTKISEHDTRVAERFYTKLMHIDERDGVLISVVDGNVPSTSKELEETMARAHARLREADRWMRRSELCVDLGKLAERAVAELRNTRKIAYRNTAGGHQYHWNPAKDPLS